MEHAHRTQARSRAEDARRQPQCRLEGWQGTPDGDNARGTSKGFRERCGGGQDGAARAAVGAVPKACAMPRRDDSGFADALSSLRLLQASDGNGRVPADAADVGDVLPPGRPARTWMTPPALPPWTAAGAADLSGAREGYRNGGGGDAVRSAGVNEAMRK